MRFLPRSLITVFLLLAAFSGQFDTSVPAAERPTPKTRTSGTALQEILTIKEEHQISAIAFSPTGNQFAYTVYDRKSVILYDIKTRKPLAIPTVSAGWGTSLAFSPDGNLIGVGTDQGKVAIWNRKTRKLTVSKENRTECAVSLAFSADGKLLASGGEDPLLGHDAWIGVWRTSDLKRTRVLKGHRSTVSSVAFSPDSASVASCSFDGRVFLWDLNRGTKTTLYADPPQMMHSIYFEGRKNLLVITDGSRPTLTALGWMSTGRPSVRRIDLKSKKVQLLLQLKHWFDSAEISADRKRLAIGGQNGEIAILKIESGKPVAAKELDIAAGVSPYGRAIPIVSFGPKDVTIIASFNSNVIKLFRIRAASKRK